MILLQAITAYLAIQGLQRQEMRFKTAHALAMLKTELQPQVEFYAQCEQQLVQKYGKPGADGKADVDGRGCVAFRDEEARSAFLKEKQELDRTVFETKAPVTVPAPEKITPEQVEALSGFITFEEG